MFAIASTSAVARVSFTSKAAKSAPAARVTARVVRVNAQSQQQPELSRRAAASLLLLPASLTLSKSAWALIPDDDDEELVAKAKANRKARLAQDKVQDRTFLKGEDITTSADGANLVPVQKAIAELAKTGSELEAGNLGGVVSSIGGSWVKDFKSAASKLSNSDESKASIDAVFSSIDSIKSSAKSNNAAAAKTSYVTLVDSLQSWAAAEGVADKLRGL